MPSRNSSLPSKCHSAITRSISSQPPAAGGVVFGQMVEMMIDVAGLCRHARRRAAASRGRGLGAGLRRTGRAGCSRTAAARSIRRPSSPRIMPSMLMKGYDKGHATPANALRRGPGKSLGQRLRHRRCRRQCGRLQRHDEQSLRRGPDGARDRHPAGAGAQRSRRRLSRPGAGSAGQQVTGEFFFAGAASGGETAATALAQVFVRVADAKQSLADAEAAPRFHHNGSPDLVYTESIDPFAERQLADPARPPDPADRLHRPGQCDLVSEVAPARIDELQRRWPIRARSALAVVQTDK